MKSKVIKNMARLLSEKYGSEKALIITKSAEKIFSSLKEENKDESKIVKSHTLTEIYPMISLYKSMLKCGIEEKEAVKFLDISYSKLAERDAKSLRNLMKIPFLYKLMPRIFKSVAIKQFGESAGFKAEFYDEGNKKVKFDMKKCLYCERCKYYDAFEIVPCFCHTDDVKNGNMHKKLIWHRTKIMGDGDDLCDFELYIDENK